MDLPSFGLRGPGLGGYAKYWKVGDLAEHILCASEMGGEIAISDRGRFAAIAHPMGSATFQSSQTTLYEISGMKIVDDAYGDLLREGRLIPDSTSVNGLVFTSNEGSYAVNSHGRIEIRSTSRTTSPPKELATASLQDLDTGPITQYSGPIAFSEDGLLVAAQLVSGEGLTGKARFGVSLICRGRR